MSDVTERLNEAAASVEVEPNRAETDFTVPPARAAARARWAEIVFVIALGIYGVMAALAHSYAYFPWDVRINHFIRSTTLPGFEQLMVGLSWLGSGVVPTMLVVGTGMALYAARLRLEGIICMVGVTMGTAVNVLTKLAIGRPRPDPTLVEVMRQYGTNSFPSGHVFFFTVFFGFLFFLAYVLLKRGPLRNVSLVVLGLIIALIGVSRIYMGAHWPSDVVGAYLVGGVWLMLMIEAYRRLKEKQKRRA
jgi:undecaprenyl-diphosphatase